jgi:hypothetical protein
MGAAIRRQLRSDPVIVAVSIALTCRNVHKQRPYWPERSVVVLAVADSKPGLAARVGRLHRGLGAFPSHRDPLPDPLGVRSGHDA